MGAIQVQAPLPPGLVRLRAVFVWTAGTSRHASPDTTWMVNFQAQLALSYDELTPES